jgi:hypothetical protein
MMGLPVESFLIYSLVGLLQAWWRAVQPLESMVVTSASHFSMIVFRVSIFSAWEDLDRIALWRGASPKILYFLLI